MPGKRVLICRNGNRLRFRDGEAFREGQVDEVILGSATQVGEQGANLARTGALMAGLGEQVPGLAVNRFCASGLEAVNLGAARNRAGEGPDRARARGGRLGGINHRDH